MRDYREGPGAWSLVWRLAACLAVGALAWRLMGLVGVVLTSPVWGVAFARPILGALSGMRHATRALVWRDVQGQHYAYRGQSLAVDEDDEGVRWLRVADVRKLLPHFPRDGALAALFGDGVRTDVDAGSTWIQAGVLDDYLTRAQNDAAVRFKVWLQRSVIHPSPAGRAHAPLSRMQPVAQPAAAPAPSTPATAATAATTTTAPTPETPPTRSTTNTTTRRHP